MEGCPLPALPLHLPDGLSASSAGAHMLCWFCHLCGQRGGVRVGGEILQRLKDQNTKVRRFSETANSLDRLGHTHPALSRYVRGDTERCTENSCHPHLLPCLCKGGVAVPSWQGVGWRQAGGHVVEAEGGGEGSDLQGETLVAEVKPGPVALRSPLWSSGKTGRQIEGVKAVWHPDRTWILNTENTAVLNSYLWNVSRRHIDWRHWTIRRHHGNLSRTFDKSRNKINHFLLMETEV